MHTIVLRVLPLLPLQGPCNEPKPWGWSVVNNAKWQSWKQLGDMAAGEPGLLLLRSLRCCQHAAGEL